MKILTSVIAISAFVFLGTASAEESATHKPHHTKKEHTHGAKDCKHKSTQHGDHKDYTHDGGHKHKEHGDHYDECEG